MKATGYFTLLFLTMSLISCSSGMVLIFAIHGGCTSIALVVTVVLLK